jgi:hypothetical protein
MKKISNSIYTSSRKQKTPLKKLEGYTYIYPYASLGWGVSLKNVSLNWVYLALSDVYRDQR